MIRISEDGLRLVGEGKWTLSRISELQAALKNLLKQLPSVAQIDLTGVIKMDSAGALFLNDLIDALRRHNDTIDVIGLREKFQPLFALVSSESSELHKTTPTKLAPSMLYKLGMKAHQKYLQLLLFLSFFGELVLVFIQSVVSPQKIKWKMVLRIVEETGAKALPIIGLMSFLIGIVLAYQLTTELKTYGATVFVVDVSGVAILREFAPLITAIIMAGRTSTSFAALIGTMKVNEELDALRTMGVKPLERLVLPRIFGLLIALPLLTVWASIFGVLGSMVMAYWSIGLTYMGYLSRFGEVIALKQLLLGMVKTPVFAVIISSIGCFQGFKTGTSADSVGRQTTRAAVQTIFLIIVADAVFSILFSMLDL